VPGSLAVELNRDSIHDIAVTNSFATNEPFTVDLQNHGEAVHVHLHLDDDLSRVARLDANNHYVEAGTTRSVEIPVKQVEDPTTGKLKIVTGYGSETEYVSITVRPPPPDPPTHAETPADPGRSTESAATDQSLTTRLEAALPEAATLPIVAFGAFAIVVALGIAAFVNGAAVMLGVGVVVVGVAAALWFLYD
jgi:hypothetical protein